MAPALSFETVPQQPRPPYADPNLKTLLGKAFKSADGRFVADYWKIQAGGKLLEVKVHN